MNELEKGVLKYAKQVAKEVDLYKPTYENLNKFLAFFSDDPAIYDFQDPKQFDELYLVFSYLYRMFMQIKQANEVEQPDGTMLKLRSIRWNITRGINIWKQEVIESGTTAKDLDTETLLKSLFYAFCKRSKHKNAINSEPTGEK